MTSITLNNINGLNFPYDIYVCDVYGNNCVLLSTISTNVPPTNTILLPPQFNTAPSIGVKIITSDNCEKFKIIDCDEISFTNYLVEQCCPSTLYWELPNGDFTDLSEATTTGDVCEDMVTTIREITKESVKCYCNPSDKNCESFDLWSYEIQPCGRKTIKAVYGDSYYWFVQNLDYTLSVYEITPTGGPDVYQIYKDTNCCSESYMSGITNNEEITDSYGCGSFTGTGMFDWFNRVVDSYNMNSNFHFYPYYDLETGQCMVSGGTIEEVVTVLDTYTVLNKVIKSDEGICYDVKSIVPSASTITWTPPTTYEDCSDCTETLSINYLVEQCCSTTQYWTLPSGNLTDFSSTIPNDCEDIETSYINIKNILITSYYVLENENTIPDLFRIEIQPCGRKAVESNTAISSDFYWYFVQNSDSTLNVFGFTSDETPIYSDIYCCSETLMFRLTNNEVETTPYGTFTGSGLFDWYNRIVDDSGVGDEYHFYPYYDLETGQCMVSGGTIEEVVTALGVYTVLNKVIKSDEDICYDVKSIVTSASTITWTPPTTYEDCSDCDIIL